jgi:hypothetical protein
MKMLFLVFDGIGYKVRDLVVLKTNNMESDLKIIIGDWIWKVKITLIFMQ